MYQEFKHIYIYQTYTRSAILKCNRKCYILIIKYFNYLDRVPFIV